MATSSNRTCNVKISADGFDANTSTSASIAQKLQDFRSLSVPDNVELGSGKQLNITFELAQNDTQAKIINVSLVGMKRGGVDGDASFTVNTSNLTQTDGKYTIPVVVTSDTGTLSATISTDGYNNKSATGSRVQGVFSGITFAPASLGVTKDEPVTLKFNISQHYTGMKVYVELDGLADNSSTGSTYIYSPTQKGEQTIYLKTAADGERTCSVQLSADGFVKPELATVEQKNITIVEAELTFSYNNRTSVTNGYKWTDNNIVFTVTKGNSRENVRNNIPVRIYNGQMMTIEVPGNITEIVFDCNSVDYANTLKNAIGTGTTVQSDKVTVSITNPKSNIYELINDQTGQIRLDAITVRYEK